MLRGCVLLILAAAALVPSAWVPPLGQPCTKTSAELGKDEPHGCRIKV